MAQDVDSPEVAEASALAIKPRCPECGALRLQEVIEGELCWICSEDCGIPPVPVNP